MSGPPPNAVADIVTNDRRDYDRYDEPKNGWIALRCQNAGAEQQRVARKKETDQEARLGKDDTGDYQDTYKGTTAFYPAVKI